MKAFRNIAIVGSGNLAEALTAAVAQLDDIRLTIAARNAARGRELAAKCRAKYVPTDAPMKDIELCIIAVSDSAIGSVAASLHLPDSAVVTHTSGATPFDILPGRFAGRGAFYPFQTFTAGREVDFTRIPVFIEGSDEATAAALEAFAGRLSRSVARADSATRRKIHLAGVFACNFANHMFTIGNMIMRDTGLDFGTLRPLIAETAAKALAAADPAAVQTGPAVRGDLDSQRRHLALLAESAPELSEIYELISKSIWEISRKI